MNLNWKTIAVLAIAALCIWGGVKLAPHIEAVRTAGAMALVGFGGALLTWLMKPPAFAQKPPAEHPQAFPPVKPE